MNPALWAACAIAGAMAGFAALGLAMDRHWEDVFGRGREPGRWRRWLQTGGAIGLVVSLAACLAMQGATVGWVLWLGVLTATSQAVVLMLSYRPRWSRAVVLAASCATLLALGALGLRTGLA